MGLEQEEEEEERYGERYEEEEEEGSSSVLRRLSQEETHFDLEEIWWIGLSALLLSIALISLKLRSGALADPAEHW